MLFLIEVADTSLERDRGVKLALYAAAGVPAVCVLDLAGDRLWVASAPGGSAYGKHGEFGRPDSARRLVLPGFPDDFTLTVGDVLGPPPLTERPT